MINVLIAGIGGASLGTELAKCLTLANNYRIFGCDISNLAYGHFMPVFHKTFIADSNDYVKSVINICRENQIKYIIPGGEAPMTELAAAAELLVRENLFLISNSPELITTFSNKKRTFEKLVELGCSVPKTKTITQVNDLDDMPFPCIVKPTTETGGSNSVFLAANKEECLVYLELLKRNDRIAIVQEYISLDEGEYTIGVLSLPDTTIVDCIVMKRIFNSKLSIAYKSKYGLISSGYSQGLIDEFADIKAQAIKIAKAIGSTGPFNIQARMKNGVLMPFEINPRFSASTFLRAKAGFNEVDIYLQNIINGFTNFEYKINYGYYLRSFEEVYVPLKEVRK